AVRNPDKTLIIAYRLQYFVLIIHKNSCIAHFFDDQLLKGVVYLAGKGFALRAYIRCYGVINLVFIENTPVKNIIFAFGNNFKNVPFFINDLKRCFELIAPFAWAQEKISAYLQRKVEGIQYLLL